MMDPVTANIGVGAAFLAGLAASGHCLAMCGGITGALGLRNAQSALDAGRYDDAAEAAGSVLSVAPSNADAKRLMNVPMA